jgi:thiopeptide-type bacteriocin biosynthesis protein
MPPAPHWHQLNIDFTDAADAEHHALATLAPALAATEDEGLITGWFFIRKSPWRFRYLPASDDTAGRAARHLHHAATSLCQRGNAKQPVQAIYEPETRAFGGTDAMTIAHQLFHADSRNILTNLNPGTGRGNHARRRETSMLLCTALMRGAGQDRFERGDIWDKVSALRTPQRAPDPDPAQWDAFTTAVGHLITVDTSPATALRTQDLRDIDPWLTAFERAGQALRDLADGGNLTRGLRAVIAHHIIFHWNRIGIPRTGQAHLAHAATQTIFK